MPQKHIDRFFFANSRISRQKIAAGLREASCQSWEWFEIYPTADRPASRPTTDRHRLDPDCGDEDWDNFGLCTGIWYLHWSLPWQVVAGASMVEWKSGQIDGATRHKGDPTPVHNLHITCSSIWQLAKTHNNKVRGRKTFSAICSEANAPKHTGHLFVFEFYLLFHENQGCKLEKTGRCDSPRSFAALRNKIAAFCRLATFSSSSFVISIVITIILICTKTWVTAVSVSHYFLKIDYMKGNFFKCPLLWAQPSVPCVYVELSH